LADAVEASQRLTGGAALQLVLECLGFLGQFSHLFAASYADQFVVFVGHEHECIAEGPLDQRRERRWGRPGAAAGDVENPFADELGGRDIMQFGGRLDLLPLGIGEADASGAARGALVCGGAVAGFGFGRFSSRSFSLLFSESSP